MWRWRIIKRALAATILRKKKLYCNETRKSISNRSIILKGEKSPVVVSRVKGSYLYYKKRLSIIQVGGDVVIKNFRINKLGVFGRGIQCN
jgi:phosphatidylserine decarboxylase